MLIAQNFNSRCERANPGWASERDPTARRPILERIHRRAWESLPYIPFGQYTQPIAVRPSVHGIVAAGMPVYWNIEKR